MQAPCEVCQNKTLINTHSTHVTVITFMWCALGDTTEEGSSTPSTKLFVGRLPLNVTGDELKEYFPGCISARIVTDKLTKSSKGYSLHLYIIHYLTA